MILNSLLCAEMGTLSMTRTIVLVEDEFEIASMLQEVLEMEGYQVMVFHSPEAVAEDIVGIRPDAFLLDIMLPGSSGIELAQELRGQGYAEACMIAMSASKFMTHLARHCGLFAAVIDKPFDLDAFLQCIERHLQQSVAKQQEELPAIVTQDPLTGGASS